MSNPAFDYTWLTEVLAEVSETVRKQRNEGDLTLAKNIDHLSSRSVFYWSPDWTPAVVSEPLGSVLCPGCMASVYKLELKVTKYSDGRKMLVQFPCCGHRSDIRPSESSASIIKDI